MQLVYQYWLRQVPGNLLQKYLEQGNAQFISGKDHQWLDCSCCDLSVLCTYILDSRRVICLGTNCWTLLNLFGGMPNRISRCDVKTVKTAAFSLDLS